MKNKIVTHYTKLVLVASFLLASIVPVMAQSSGSKSIRVPIITKVKKALPNSNSIKEESSISETEPNNTFDDSGVISFVAGIDSRVTMSGTTQGVQGDHLDYWNISTTISGKYYIAPSGGDGDVVFTFTEFSDDFGVGQISQQIWNPGDQPFILDMIAGNYYQLLLTDNFAGAATIAYSVFIAGDSFFDPSTSASMVSLSTEAAFTFDEVEATVTLFDQFGDAIVFGGETVEIFANNASLPDVVDNENGTYSITFTSDIAQTVSVTATINGDFLESSAEVEFSLSPPAPSTTASLLMVSTESSKTTEYVEVTVTLYDQYDNMYETGGEEVEIFLNNESMPNVVDNENGTYSLSFTSEEPQSVLVTASVNGNTLDASANVEFYVDPSWELGIVLLYAQDAYDDLPHFGVSSIATDGYDEGIDVPAPPYAPTPFIQGVFVREDFSTAFGNDFISDIREPYDLSNSVQEWHLTVISSIDNPNQNAVISIIIPAEFNYFPIRIVDDVDPGNTVVWTGSTDPELETSLNIEFLPNAGQTTHTFTIYVGAFEPPTIDLESVSSVLRSSQIIPAGTETDVYFEVYGYSEFDVTVELSYDGGENYNEEIDFFVPPFKKKETKVSDMGYPFYLGWYGVFTGVDDFVGTKDLKFKITLEDGFNDPVVYYSDHRIVLAASTQQTNVMSGWNLMGAPFESVNGGETLLNNFEDNLTAYSLSYEWAGVNYIPSTSFTPTTGYWIGASENAVVDVTGTVIPHVDDNFNIQKTKSSEIKSESFNLYNELNTGWQLLSTPYVIGSELHDLTIYGIINEESVSFSALEANMEGLFYAIEYTGEGFLYENSTTMAPFKGYWVGSLINNAQLHWAPTYYSNEPGKKVETAPLNLLSLVATDSKGIQSNVKFGFNAEATNGFDAKYDRNLPPMSPNGTAISLNGMASVLGNRFGQLVFKGDEMIQTRINLDGELNSTVTLSWNGGEFNGIATLYINGESYFLGDAGSTPLKANDNAYIELTPVVTSTEISAIPTLFELGQNFPNPFNPTTTIDYKLASATHVKLSVINMLGQEVSVLVDGQTSAGAYSVKFDASHLSSGVYLYRLQAGSFVQIKKMSLIK